MVACGVAYWPWALCALQTSALYYQSSTLVRLADLFELPDSSGATSHLKILSTSRYVHASELSIAQSTQGDSLPLQHGGSCIGMCLVHIESNRYEGQVLSARPHGQYACRPNVNNTYDSGPFKPHDPNPPAARATADANARPSWLPTGALQRVETQASGTHNSRLFLFSFLWPNIVCAPIFDCFGRQVNDHQPAQPQTPCSTTKCCRWRPPWPAFHGMHTQALSDKHHGAKLSSVCLLNAHWSDESVIS
jgi:hypothetical protein